MYKKNSKDGKKCNAPFFIDVFHCRLISLFYFDTKNRLENNLPINWRNNCKIFKLYIFTSIVLTSPILLYFFVRFHSSLCEVVLLSQRLKEDMQFFHKSSHSSSKLQAHCLSVCLCSALLWQYVVRCKNKDIMGVLCWCVVLFSNNQVAWKEV